jgi:deferrochelatase/peroxidase EfeB
LTGCPFGAGTRRPGRRFFLASAGAGLFAAATPARADATGETAAAKGIVEAARTPSRDTVEPFRGEHQGGIVTASQNHTVFAAFDLVSDKAADVVGLLKLWTEAAARLSAGQPAPTVTLAGDGYGGGYGHKRGAPAPTVLVDSGDTLGLGPARLTVTFGFGSGLFSRDGQDRYGLAARRPEALVDLPRFHGDQLQEARTGGDLSVQACADDPQVAFHAVRHLVGLATGIAQLRWTQAGFVANAAARDTPRNLMGFKDGTQNPQAAPVSEETGGVTRDNPGDFDHVVWVGAEGPAWMRGGSYLVARRIRIALEHWDRTPVDFQEEVIGRHKLSGAPIGKQSEFDPLDLDRTNADGAMVIAENAHVRLAAAGSNDGARILRRSYSYNDGSSVTAERWPPWRQGMELDAGLLFVCYQRDPRGGFIRIFEQMAKFDALNQFATHTGGGLFACPRGARDGEFIGQGLFDAA